MLFALPPMPVASFDHPLTSIPLGSRAHCPSLGLCCPLPRPLCHSETHLCHLPGVASVTQRQVHSWKACGTFEGPFDSRTPTYLAEHPKTTFQLLIFQMPACPLLGCPCLWSDLHSPHPRLSATCSWQCLPCDISCTPNPVLVSPPKALRLSFSSVRG